jgi:hypothetical protein
MIVHPALKRTTTTTQRRRTTPEIPGLGKRRQGSGERAEGVMLLTSDDTRPRGPSSGHRGVRNRAREGATRAWLPKGLARLHSLPASQRLRRALPSESHRGGFQGRRGVSRESLVAHFVGSTQAAGARTRALSCVFSTPGKREECRTDRKSGGGNLNNAIRELCLGAWPALGVRTVHG